MIRNVGSADRIVRVVLGVAALVGAVATGAATPLGIGLLVVGGVLVVTAAVGFCPLYRLLGVRTAGRS